MRAPLLAAVILSLSPAVCLCGSAPAPCGDEDGSCGVSDGPAFDVDVGAQEAEEAAALRVELLQKARLARRSDAADSALQASLAEDCTDSDDGLKDAVAPFGLSIGYCSQAADKCNAWPVGSVIRSYCCATCSQESAPAPSPIYDPNLTRASQVCVSNKGGFKLKFELWDTETNMRMPATNSYAAGGKECRNISDILMVEGGHPVVTVVYLTAGKTITLSPVIYDPALSAAAGSHNLTCKGGTGTPSCVKYLTDGSQADVPQFPAPDFAVWRPAVRASQICLQNSGGYRLRFQVWNTAWNALSPVSDGFDHSRSKCISGDFMSEVQEGNPLVPITYVQGGGPLMFHSVIYDVTAAAAIYSCGGGTGTYSCSLIGA
mmetsp:Transcript_49717/g.128989  ORF Transcript_49717/g.128989 Transcript_49717/m.128989 type:complete len:375 (-) Transcript_49717:215-1339(-)